MKRFYAIEGLRGWLAWTVVLAHLAYASGIYTHGIGQRLGNAGSPAVIVFIIVSGFVIAHLITERPESYRIYLLRRFMRVFPLFAVTCVIGYFAYDVDAATLTKVSYAADPGFFFGSYISRIAASDHRYFWLHILAHLAMLHGAIADKLLPFSQVAFNGPGWSLSLEWQFYLLAPLAILAVRRRQGLVQIALAVCVMEFAARAGLFGSFLQPSFLPQAAGYFAIGLATRLVYPAIAATTWDPRIFLSLGIVVLPLVGDEAKPILVWMMIVLGLEQSRSGVKGASFVRLALESRPAIFIGSRSYSTYLCHMPIIAICHRLWFIASPLAKSAPTFLALTAMTVPVTLFFAELLYRGVERPGIALGSLMAHRMESHASARLPEAIPAGGPEI
jgi:peptidoglycan/LPS O-acetylase OafA/YrhL